MTTREIPSDIADSWQRLSTDPPLAALASSHALYRGLASWQTALVHDAIAGGASWEEIGAALGTTKQGAWARFRVALDEIGAGGGAMQDRRQERQRIRELWAAGQERLRQMEAAWRQEEQQLRTQLEESKDHLVQARHRHQRDRREARQRLRQEIVALKT